MHYVSRRQASRTRIPMPPLSETFPGNNHRPAGRRPTMREVAAVAGVSLSTVSRAINGDPKVAADLAEKVRQAVAMLGYRRDITATTLRRADRLSASIGLVFDDVANPFHAMLQRGIEDVARDRGVLAFAGSSDEDAERERDLVQAFLSRRVDGLIVVPAGSDHGYLVRDRYAGVAVVFVDRPPGFIDADVVLSDHAGGARAATAHLLAAGHRRIGYLGGRPPPHRASSTPTSSYPTTRAAPVPPPPTCSPPATGGSATSATAAASTARPSACAATRRRSRAPESRTTGRSCAWSSSTARWRPARRRTCWRQRIRRPPCSPPRTSSRSARSPRSARAACSTSSRSSASTTCRSPTRSTPGSRSWRRTPAALGAQPRRRCSRAS